jgi:hypothetical protein
MPLEEIETPIRWYHYDLNGKRKKIHAGLGSNDKYVFTQDNGLVIISVAEGDGGRYDCKFGRDTISTYSVSVDMGRCSAPDKTTDYQKVYSAWCNEFQKYKTALKEWEKKRRDTQCPNNISTVINVKKNLNVHGSRDEQSSRENYIY